MTNGEMGFSQGTKAAGQHVFAELLRRDALPYRTADGIIGVNTSKGNRLELRIVPSSDDSTDGDCHFAVTDYQPRPELFLVCVEFDGEEIASVWVFPSISFYVYAEPDEERGLVRLSLDAARADSFADSLREYVSFFRDRWDPIVQFDHLRQYMPPLNAPGFERTWEDFEDILMLMEFSESRDRVSDERIPFEPPDPDPDYGRPLIEITPRAQEQLDSIPLDDLDEVSEAIRSLADDPHPSGSIGLEGMPGNYRVRRIP